MQLKRFFRYLALHLGLVACTVPSVVLGAQLVFTPSTGSFPADTPFSVKVTLDPQGEKVNASDGEIKFDEALLTVVSVSKDGSAFSLWTSDPSYSNGDGTIKFSGGTPNAFSSPGVVVTVTFKGKSPGSAKATFAKGSVLAADGKGTEVYKSGGEATWTITEATPPTSEGDGQAPEGGSLEGSGVTLPAPVISSPTNPKPENWYATTTAVFMWKLLPDVLNVRVSLTESDGMVPDKVLPGGAATSTKFTDIKDGVWFFNIQYRNDSGWGDVGRRTLNIDTVPPKEFDFALIDGDAPKFTVNAEDELSGVERYEIILGSTSAAMILVKDMSDNSLPVPPQPGGQTHVTIKAYDKAGNSRASEKDLTLPEVKKQSAKKEEEVPVQPTWTWERILLILFAIAIGVLGTLHYNSRKKETSEKLRLLREVAEVRDKNDKIFSAMREEFEQMVNDFDVKPQLTVEERELLEKIKEVLEVSEELVDTSMEELKKSVHG